MDSGPSISIRSATPENVSKKNNDYEWDSGRYHLEERSPRGISAGATPTGILRLGDLSKVYSPTGATSISNTGIPTSRISASAELKFFAQIEPSSPQPSIDRLSVTFAEDSTTSRSFSYIADIKAMDKVHFPEEGQVAEESNEEDYSESIKAIIQRRASIRRSRKRHSRRGSSPFSPDVLPEMDTGRRRSSVFTTSSGDTAITVEDSFAGGGTTQEQIFENIKLHKEVLSSVKMQPWNMRRKVKLVQQAKAYVKKHEGELQERLAQSHSTKDMLARWNLYLLKKCHRLKRELANLSNWLIPWESRIKEIESHFGSVVASYFIFLRWLFWVNIAISSIWIAFVAVPEMLTAGDFQSERKSILPEDKYNATNFLTLWDFEGVFKYSPMFYGWYTNVTRTDYGGGYRLPLAYFCTGLAVYIFSFVATLRKMAENSRMSKLSEKEDECIFSWKLFTGWDYMIGNTETATNRVASIIMSFKEALLEEAEKKRESQSWKIIGSRILVNIGVLSLLALSAFAVIKVVARSNEKGATSTTWRRNEITVVMSLITLFFPIFFELLGYFEHYHPRKQLRLQLARIMVLNLLNLYSLIFALFEKITDMTNKSENFFNASNATSITTSTSTPEVFYMSAAQNYQDHNAALEMQVGNLVREILENVTNTMATTIATSSPSEQETPITDDGLLEYLTTTATTLTVNYFENMGEIFTTSSADADIETTTNPHVYELDFTPLRDALQELFTSFFDIFENGTTQTVDETWLKTTLTTTLTSLFDTESGTDYSTTTTTDPTEFTYSTEFTESTDLTSVGSTTNLVKNVSSPEVTTIVTSTTSHKLTPSCMDYQSRSRLRNLCWETMFGQELVKLTIMDLILTLLSILTIDFFRGLFVRYMNSCWCWDLEKKFPQYGDFKVAENILHLVNNQGMVWMGMFFSPGLVVINVFKLYIMMYLRSWAVLTCNVPHEIIFRASRSNNFYYALLLMMLFLCVLPVSYAIVWLKPSGNCGPFSGYPKIFHIFTKTLRAALPESTHHILDYIASPGIVIPLLMLLVLIIYYLISLSAALREANNDLKIQLRRERTEERRKMFQIVDRRRRGGSDGSETHMGKWRKLMRSMPNNKSFEDKFSKLESLASTPVEAVAAPPVVKGVLSKFLARAIKNRTEQTDNVTNKEDVLETNHEEKKEQDDEGTDTETHDSVLDEPVNTSRQISGKRRKIPKISKRTDKSGSAGLSSSGSCGGTTIKAGTVGKSRKDSTASNWSEVIPVITISKTESSECILEDKTTAGNGKVEQCQEQESSPISVDVEQARDGGSGGSSPKVRYVLKKQPVVDKDEGVQRTSGDSENRDEGKQQAIKEHCVELEKSANDTDEDVRASGKSAGKVFHESGQSSGQTTDTRTESSTDYRDSTFSN